MKSSLTIRVMVQFAVLITATTALVLFIGSTLLDRQMKHEFELMHDEEFEELRGLIGATEGITSAALRERIGKDTDADAALYFVQVHDGHGKILFRSDNLGKGMLPIRGENETRYTDSLPGLGPVLISVFKNDSLRIQLASPLGTSVQVFKDYSRTACFLVLGTAFLSLGLGYAFSRFTLRPVRAIAATASRIGADNLKERITLPKSRDELAELANLLNRMFDRLETSFQHVQQFTADASHELKTPLSLIRLSTDKLEPHLRDDEEGIAVLGDLREEIARMNAVIENLLFLARAESGGLKLPMKLQRMDSLISDIAEDAALLAEDSDVRFSVTGNEPGEVLAEANLLRQLFFNLLDNALKVSDPGTTLTLSSRILNNHWQIVLEDEGPGLEPDQLERIFKRFVRIENRRREDGMRGSGLGLAICRSIVELHGGRIHAENRSDRKGLRLVVDMPVA